MKRSGFTLLEVLVASVLMGMLVTILTMIFNQSAIAWRTGKAGVASLSKAERQMSRIHMVADNALPYTEGNLYCIVSPWDETENGKSKLTLNKRGVKKATALDIGKVNYASFQDDDAGYGSWLQGLDDPKTGDGGSAFIVGVKSAGPDHEWDTEDDISTWPDEVN